MSVHVFENKPITGNKLGADENQRADGQDHAQPIGLTFTGDFGAEFFYLDIVSPCLSERIGVIGMFRAKKLDS